MDNRHPASFRRRFLSYLISALIAGQPVFPAFAATTPANNATQMDRAANGVPVVNIATPNGAGISHNQFKDYNVGKEGMILNNATGQLNQTQLGGLIQNNPNLKAGSEARGIINEVTGANRSQLQGYTEVAGKAASVMVANPYGITCNGCGFINTPNVTLTTGKPVFDANGNLQSLNVTKGAITIEGQGLNASQADALSIIARATEVNAQIHAKDLKIIAGANRVDAGGNATAIAGEGAAPVVAVDTGALGGMYANRIHLVSSEKGVGVNLGNLNARQGDITLDASGKLALKNSLASGSLTAKGDSVTLSGEHKSGGPLTVVAQRDVNVEGSELASDGNITLNGNGKLTLNNSRLTAGNDINLKGQDLAQNATSRGDARNNLNIALAGTATTQGLLIAGKNVELKAGKLSHTGQLVANGNAHLNASGLDNSGTVQSQKNLAVSGVSLNNRGQMLSGGGLDVAVQTLNQSGTLSAKGSASLSAAKTLNNAAGGQILSEGALTVKAGQILQSGTLSGKKSLAVSGDSLSTAAKSLTTSQGGIALSTARAALDGKVIAHGDLAVQATQLSTQANAQLQSGGSITLSAQNAALSGTQAAKENLNVTADKLTHSGKSNAQIVTLHSGELINSGTITAPSLSLMAKRLVNGGKLQGDRLFTLKADQFENLAQGSIYSAYGLAFILPQFTNAGLIASDADINLQVDALTNSGLISSGTKLQLSGKRLNNAGEMNATTLDLRYSQVLNQSSGLLLGKTALGLKADSLNNLGSIAGDFVHLNAAQLSNGGLLQGSNALAIDGNQIDISADGRVLTAGALTLKASGFKNFGTLQGRNASVTANNWLNGGSLLGTDGVNVSVAQNMTSQGDLLSQGNTVINAQNLNNQGSLMSAGEMTLAGNELSNSGALQANNLTLNQTRIENKGTIIGLNALTLEARMAMAAPLLELVNSGKLLTQGALTINGGDISNGGTWQGQQILLNAQKLSNDGAIQSADALTLKLTGNLTAGKSSKITANGRAALSALDLSNSGQWAARRLTLTGESLNNAGQISGVDDLSVTLNGKFSQQSGKTLLSGGALALEAAAVDNAGQIQGRDTRITAGSLNNSGRLQGGNALVLETGSTLSNSATGVLLSEKALRITTPGLINYGIVQGGESSVVNAGNSLRNDGKLLSGKELTLNTASLSNNGWLQATTLLLNAATTANAGTLLGTNSLTLNADKVTHQTAGKLYSGGNLLLTSTGFDQLGQVIALGNLTLKLSEGFTGKNVIAAGDTLNITSNGAIANQSVMQGQAVNLKAGGALTNNGQITTGSGSSTLSGSQIAMNAAGTLQAGGDVTLNSRSDITTGGFLGTAGTLTLNATGSLLNTALLYAGNNMYLLANSIKNQRGDILAGNSLWMQRDTAGNASAEVVNTSGNIETQNGDITIRTGHLLNEAEGLTISQYEREYPDAIPGLSEGLHGWYYGMQTPDFEVDIEEWKHNGDNIVWKSEEECTGSGAIGSGGCRDIYYYRLKGEDTRRYLLGESVVSVSATGGAARIAAGRDIAINAGTLDNRASHILAERNATLKGDTLNNLSAEGGRQAIYVNAEYRCEWFYNDCDSSRWQPLTKLNENTWAWANSRKFGVVPYILGERTTEFVADGGVYRSVIQAGGNVTASFTSDISNTTTTANAGGISNTISAPTLNTLSSQTIGNSQQGLELASADAAAVNSPEWQDNLVDAVAQISGGSSLSQQQGSLYPLPSGNNGYFVTSTDPNSPYLITTNPKLDGLGQLDQSLFGDLYDLMGVKPGSAPRETNSAYTDQNKFLGSSYFLDRLNLKPEYDYRFLGDAAFDTRYVSNAMLNQTGNRYLNGVGSDLEQMQYLMDNAARAQQSLGLNFGVALTADQIAALDHSILWWEATVINGETVLVPKLYLSPKDVTVNNGSVIAGNNVTLNGGNITNSGSTLSANNNLSINSDNSISNLNAGLISAGGGLQLSTLGDINNIGSTISGKTVALESINGSINNITLADTWSLAAPGKNGQMVSLSTTQVGDTASITSLDSLSLLAGSNINITGANLAAGGDLLMKAWGDIAVTANQITESYSQSGFRGKDATSKESVTQSGSTITAGGNLGMQAGNDLTLAASAVNAGGNATLMAGNDLNLNAAQTGESASRGKSESHSTDVARTTVSSGGDLQLAAGRDINSQAAGLAAENDVAMQAGRDVNLLAQETTEGNSYTAKKKVEINESVRQQGTEIASGGNTKIIAGRDVNSEAAQVTASGDIGVGAGRDVNLTTATESDYHYREETKTKKGFLSKKTTHTIEEDSATREAGTLLSGDNVTVSAGNNLLVQGSAVVGDGDVSLSAGNNIDIVAATNTVSTYRLNETKKSGLMGTGGIGITVGSAKSRHEMNEDGTTQSQSASTVGSTGGNVSISAGGQAHIGGSDLIAGKDLSITGDSVVIDPGHDRRTRDESFEQKSSGLTLALSGAAGSAVNSAISSARSAKDESDDRLAALKGTQAALSGVQASQAMDLDAARGNDADNTNTVGITLSYGSQSSKSKTHNEQTTASGSTLNAGDNLSIIATGGDVNITGSQIKAGKDVLLDAARDVNLVSSRNTQLLEGSNKSSGGSVGVGIGVGSGGWGITVSASGNKSHGKESGNGTQQNETTIDAGNQVSIISGRDATLAGAQVSGNKVMADVGRDLTISSLQDSDRYDSKQSSVSGGASFSFGSMSGSASLSLSQDKMHSNYDSVVEQSGIFAGNGGFDVTVGNHTQLDGAVVASTATADKNHLDTGTLGFTDIGNRAEYDVSHSGGSFSTGGSIGSQFAGNMANTLLVGAGGSGDAEGTTKSAVTDGTITIRDKDKQQQDVADLSRDTEHANGSISPIFDKEKEQKRLEMAQVIGELGTQAADIARTQGDIAAINDGKAELARKGITEPGKGASKEEWADYNAKLAATYSYKTAQKEWGTGSTIQQGISAATLALQGLAGGDLKAALAGGASPYLAEAIKVTTGDNEAARVMAHAIIAGVVAELQGKDGLAGATGAATTALAGEAIKRALYGDVPVDQLTESQKQTLVALGTLAAGMAGGVVGDSTASAIAGAQAGQNELSNNMASIGLAQQMMAQSTLNAAAMAEAGSTNANDVAALALTKTVKSGLDAACLANNTCVMLAIITAQSEANQSPNIGKDLTADEKAELGGTGSGTPGGWGPEDEENARNNKGNKPSQNGSNFTNSEIDDRITSANKPINNQGMSAAARAWEKHAGRPGGTFEPLKGNQTQKNAAAENFIRDLLNDPGTIRNELSRGGVEYRAPSGQGVRFNPDGSFNTLLDPPVKR